MLLYYGCKIDHIKNSPVLIECNVSAHSVGTSQLGIQIKLSSPYSHFELIPGNILRRNNTCQWLIQQWLMLNKIDWVPCAVHTAFSIFTPTLTVWPQNIISIRNRLAVWEDMMQKGAWQVDFMCAKINYHKQKIVRYLNI